MNFGLLKESSWVGGKKLGRLNITLMPSKRKNRPAGEHHSVPPILTR